MESNIYSKTFEFLNKLKCADFGVNAEIETVRLSLKFHKEMRNCLFSTGICDQIGDKRLEEFIRCVYAAIISYVGNLTVKEFVNLITTHLTKAGCFREENRELTAKFIEVLDERLRRIYSTEDLIAMTGLDSVVSIANAVIICSAFRDDNMTSRYFCKNILNPSLELIGIDPLYHDNLLQVLLKTCEDFLISYMPNNLRLNVSPAFIKDFYPPTEERPPFKIRLYLLLKDTFTSLAKITPSDSDLEHVIEVITSGYGGYGINGKDLIRSDLYSAIDNLYSGISDNKKDIICKSIMYKISIMVFEDEDIMALCKYINYSTVPDKLQESDLKLDKKSEIVSIKDDVSSF